jgi:hypothetical protein
MLVNSTTILEFHNVHVIYNNKIKKMALVSQTI